MGIQKLNIKRKINREKSNKLIYAVAAGLLILMIGFLSYVVLSEKTGDKKEIMEKSLAYLKKTSGIMAVRIIPPQNTVYITFDHNVDKMDFPLIARYAGFKVANQLPQENITIWLCEDREDNPIYSVVFRKGEMAEEKLLKEKK